MTLYVYPPSQTTITGLATETTLAAIQVLVTLTNTYVDGIEGALTTLNAKDFATQTTLAAILAKLSTPTPVARTMAHDPYYRNYAVANLTGPAWTPIILATYFDATVLEIFDSSGEILQIAVGAAGSELLQFDIFPGGNGRVELAIPANSRVSIKPLTGSPIAAGAFILNMYT